MAAVNTLGPEHKGQTVSQLLITQHMMKTSKFYIVKEAQPEQIRKI